MKFKLENVESERTQELANLIREYNRSNREPSKSEPLNIYVEDEQGNILAGMVAETFGNWLEIEYLYVRDDFRGKGIGSKILDKAEKESKSRGCKYSFVNTFNFQAPNFYKKHGYQEVFTLKEYPYVKKMLLFTSVYFHEEKGEKLLKSIIFYKWYMIIYIGFKAIFVVLWWIGGRKDYEQYWYFYKYQ